MRRCEPPPTSRRVSSTRFFQSFRSHLFVDCMRLGESPRLTQQANSASKLIEAAGVLYKLGHFTLGVNPLERERVAAFAIKTVIRGDRASISGTNCFPLNRLVVIAVWITKQRDIAAENRFE